MKPILVAASAVVGALFLSVLAAGFFFAACTSNHSGGMSFGWSGHNSEEAERSEVHELHLASGATLSVRTPYGSIRVRTTESGAGSVHAHVRAHGKTVADAEERLKRVRVVIAETDAGAALSIEFDHDTSFSRSEPMPGVDFEVTVPTNVKLELVSDSGNVSAEVGPYGTSRLSSSYGAVRAENVRGDATVKSSSGNVAVAGQSAGAVEASTDYGTVSLSDVEGSTVRARTSSGNVKAVNVRAGTISLESDYGNIHVESAIGELTTRTASGNIKIANTTAQLSANTSYGKVDLDGVFKTLDARSSSGDVRVCAREGSAVESAWKLRSDYGRVALQAPRDLSFDLSAKTEYGDVDVGYAMELPPGTTTRKGSSLNGKINGGGPLVTLHSSSGNVSVKPLDP